MAWQIHKNALARQYLLFAVMVPLLLLCLATLVGLANYYNVQKIRESHYGMESNKLSEALSRPLEYVEEFSKLIGEKVSAAGTTDPNIIATIFQDTITPAKLSRDIYTWTVFDFVTPDGQVIVSSTHGVWENPKRVTTRDRAWFADTSRYPWRLYFNSPDVGITSGEWIIPAGYGISDMSGKFIGTVSLGLNINKLRYNLEKFFPTQGIGFVVLTDDYQLVLQSSSLSQKVDRTFFKEQLEHTPELQALSGRLPTPIIHDGIEYSYFRRLAKYPYIILLGKNTESIREDFQQMVLPQIIQAIVIGAFVLMLLYFFSRQVITPLIRLSEVADRLSKGDPNVRIPRGGPYEIYSLSRQMVNVQRYIKRIRRIDRKLIKAKREADRANQAKSNFLANMSHELRTPLNAIIGYSEIMKGEIFGPLYNEKYLEYANDIHSSGTHLLGLINDILDISRIEDDKFHIEERKVSVAHTVAKCLKILSEQAKRSNIVIETTIPKNLPFLNADELRIKQIIINLISNAIKFSESGHKVWVSLKANNTGFFITVKDEGIGISKEHIPIITDKFQQVDSSLSRKADGVGIGLWLTKKLIEAHQGEITIQSELGKGTAVTAWFPPNRMFPAEDVATTPMKDPLKIAV